jgi:hypothetical protein
VLEDDRAVALEVLVERDGRWGTFQQLGERTLAGFDRLTPQIVAVEYEQIERPARSRSKTVSEY